VSDIYLLMASDPGSPEPPARDRLVAVLLTVAAAVVGAALVVGRPDGAALAPRFGQQAWSRPPGEAVAAGRAGTEELLALRRTANDSGKAVAVWAADGGGPWRQLADYLSYDSGCLTSDPVCADLLRTGQGLGLFLLRDRPDGRSFLLVQVPAGRTVEVGGRAIGEAPAGRVVEVPPGTPPGVRVTLPDGRQYRLPEMPGTVL
jgi:hypothetical protein